MKHSKYIFSLFVGLVLFASCNKDVLDRPPLTKYPDSEYWRNEEDVRMFGNGFYTQYFNGFNTGFTLDYAPVRGYTFNDDLTIKGPQTSFEANIPSSRVALTEGADWMLNYSGPNWNFAWVRKSNTFLDRIENVAKPNLSADAYKHWTAVARFFRAVEYCRLVSVFGNVPYYNSVVLDTDLPALYKDRDDRGVVMDNVYDDFKYVMANMRETDGAQNLNRYIAAAFISRYMLFEGTYENYHGINAARSKKYLEFARDAAEYLINSGKYNFSRDFKSTFSSENLSGHPEVILYRVYDAALTITHSTLSYSNGSETVMADPNLNFVKSYLAIDGKPYQASGTANASSFTIPDLVKTRDPRFEASIIDKPLASSTTLFYGYKFAPREAIAYIGKPYPAIYTSSTNTTDAPVIRYGEVVLNWIEAKAVLAEAHGGTAITQADLDKSINALRNRPLDAVAVSKGVQKTLPLAIGAIPVDPSKDADVSALMWEIRRERRVEMVFEHSRLLDLKRWKKLNYMDFSRSVDYLLGPWVNLPVDAPAALVVGAKVRKGDSSVPNAQVVTYNGNNASDMVGFFMVPNAANRNAFTDKSYLAPVGQAQIVQYAEKGFKLTQSPGW